MRVCDKCLTKIEGVPHATVTVDVWSEYGACKESHRHELCLDCANKILKFCESEGADDV